MRTEAVTISCLDANRMRACAAAPSEARYWERAWSGRLCAADLVQIASWHARAGPLHAHALSRCDSASNMYCQIWQAGEQQPMMLWLTPPEFSQSEIESSTSVVMSLMLVALPRSKQLVWLPLSAEQAGQVDQDHAAPSCEDVNWQDCLQALDTSLVQADARKASSKQPQQKQPVVQTSIRSYMRRKLRRGNQTAQPAESAASVLIREKRRQSPDNSTAGGSKAQRIQ